MPTRNDYKYVLAWMGFFVVIVGVLFVLNFVVWNMQSAAEVVSVDNIKRLSQQANQMEQQLDTLYNDYLAQKRAVDDFAMLYGDDQRSWPQGKDEEYLQAKSHLRNSELAYNQLCNELQAMYNDEWRSLPAPNDVEARCELN